MKSNVYPDRLLPKPEYIIQINRNDLSRINPWLQRKCYDSFEECCIDGNPDRVTPKAFGDVGLTRMSVNLMGGMFLVGDEIWHQSMNENDNWDGSLINIDDFEGKYKKEKGALISIYFSFNHANALEWNFPRTFPDAAQHDRFKEAIIMGLSSFNKKETYVLKAHSECHHTATALNYWHMEVRSLIDSLPPEEILKVNSKYQKKAIHEMIEKLRVKSSLSCPSKIHTIPDLIYKRRL